MKKTPVQIKDLKIIDYEHPISFLGSCFSVNLFEKFRYNGFRVASNPWGVIFNPNSLGQLLLNLKTKERDFGILQRNDIYFSWDANSSLFGYSESEVITKLIESNTSFEQNLSKSNVLFVTFGTAWIYELNENNRVVANCHKLSQSNFEKKLLSIDEIVIQWYEVVELLQSRYPNLKIVFTLSPVRHIKDGLVENARSKAILLESIHQLVDHFTHCHYFPAYELVLDELRDYGYFNKDGLHPNEIAIDVLWNRLFTIMFTDQTQEMAHEMLELRKIFDHNIQFNKSVEGRKFEVYRTERLKAFQEKYPNINFEE